MSLKILVADDHPLVLEGIRTLLQGIEPDLCVLEAKGFSEVKKIIAKELKLDLVILDLAMPGMDGMHSIVELRHKRPCLPIVIVSASEEASDIRNAINSGANGYIPKSSGNEVMQNALRLVLSGGLYLPAQWAGLSRTNNNGETLTLRQQEIMEQLAIGKTNKEIARIFSISDKTVKAHLSDIFKRLEVGNRTQAVHQAKKQGLLKNAGNN